MTRISELPFLVVLLGLAALSMLLPAIVAAQELDFETGRGFFYSCLLFLTFAGFIAIALSGFKSVNPARTQLITLVSAYVILPAIYAVPMSQVLLDTTFLNSYFEMVSSFTTTGASTYEPARLSGAVHFWRAEVAWMGGLFVWVTAAAILAPLNLGGYEVSANSEPGRGVAGTSTIARGQAKLSRLSRIFTELFPIYTGLTIVLWIALIIAGDEPLVSVVYAMSVMSTSGIVTTAPEAGIIGGISAEILILIFLLFALSRRSFSTENAMKTTARLIDDPEMRVGLFLILSVSAMFFLRHFVGASEVGTEVETARALNALWGSVFTVISFLTTTGFVSEYWADAQSWSGLTTPGFALLGLAMIGGGVATTAGGVKLLRVYALYIHGRRELLKLTHPSIITGTGKQGREIGPRGVYVAWLFFMLFALSVAAIWIGLAATGIPFEDAMLLTVSAITTTGPLAPVVSNGEVGFVELGEAAKGILIVAMILGRLETLALISLLTADFWRS